jgi:hypothetical protein
MASHGDSYGFRCGGGGWFAGVRAGGVWWWAGESWRRGDGLVGLTDSCETGAAITGVVGVAGRGWGRAIACWGGAMFRHLTDLPTPPPAGS